MTFDVLKETIEEYLDEVASGRDERLPFLLKTALLRPLCKELAQQDRPDNLAPLSALPKAAPGWLRQAFNEGRAVHGFRPEGAMRGDIAHIADWLHAALVNGDPWLGDVDAQGRPAKLVKLGSLRQATVLADKAMRVAAQQALTHAYQDDIGHQTVRVFASGYRMVRLLTPTALDQESGFLGHCIGNGGYDASLTGGSHAYYSLRDLQGRSHATLEVDLSGHVLRQCKGKQNAPPVAKYMPDIQAFLKEQRFRLDESPGHTGLIEQNGEYHDIRRLPPGCHCRGSLDLSGMGITSLPEGLHVGGSLDLCWTGITSLPEGLRVGGSLYVRGTPITSLPEGLHVGGSLDLRGTPITSLPKGVHVGDFLDLSGMPIISLPEGLHVGGSLHLRGTGITSLPAGLHVGGLLHLPGTGITLLPNGLRVGGPLHLRGTEIALLPNGLRGGRANPPRFTI